MRAGGCAVQQALTADAAAVVKHAVSLARRRGHVQVTPLHVASAMLSAAGLLRAACLRSHSHPLQCNALELCFNVALNRLPTSAMFHHGHHAPALSNALVAAFKRAQAHQRRGSVESQQPPLLAVKVELEQLIISILDDPSVSRVMREAGFSSTEVKANVEKAVSLDKPNASSTTAPNPRLAKLKESRAKSDDVLRVLDCMASGRTRSVVVVGECPPAVEGAVRVVMDKASKGELQHQHECLKNLQFVPLSVASFRRMTREEVEAKASELRALVRGGCAAGKGVVLVLEDLGYAAEAWAAASENRRGSLPGAHRQDYCPVEHVVMEVSTLVCGSGGAACHDRFWLLGSATHPVYMKCRAGQPSLEAVWALHPVVVPADGGLTLGLTGDSDQTQASQAMPRTGWPFLGAGAAESDLTCCTEAAVAPSRLPPWLRRYQDPEHTGPASCGTNQLQDRCNKWNSMNGSAQLRAHHGSELTLNFSPSTSPAASSVSTYTRCYTNLNSSSWHLSFQPRRQKWRGHRHGDGTAETHDFAHANPNPSSGSVSNSSDGTAEAARRRQPRFKELTAENLKILCNALERRVARHKDIVPKVASVVLQCRSGMRRRSGVRREKLSSATWLLFQGGDSNSKEAIAKELARLVFGAYTEFTSIARTESCPVHSDSSYGELPLKRKRSPDSVHGQLERLYEAVSGNPHRVIMVGDIEQLDYDSEIGIKNAIASGRVKKRRNGEEEVGLEDAIIVLSCDMFDSRSRACSPRVRQKVGTVDGGEEEEEEDGGEKEVRSCFSLDLNACAESGDGEEETPVDDVGILDAVDGVFFFRSPEEL